MILLTGCKTAPPPVDVIALSREFTESTLSMSPVTATAVGYHVHNGRRLDEELDDLSAAAIERQRQFWLEWQKRLAAVDAQTVDVESRADLELMRNQIEYALYDLNELKGWQHNPTGYVELIGNALFTPYSVKYAPDDERFRHIIERLKAVPKVLDAASANLKDVPGVWRRVAKAENDGNIALVDSTLRAAVPTALKTDYDSAATIALAALRGFNNYLDGLPDAGADAWRLGPEKYEKKFAFVMGGTRTVEQALAEAEADLQAVRRQMFETALPLYRQLHPGKPDPTDINLVVGAVLDRVAQKGPTRANYFAEAQKTLTETRAFLKSHDAELLASPTRDNLQIIETPEFMRGIYAVGGFNPAPVFQPELGAFYWVTPIPKDWPEARVVSKLREYNDYGLRILTIHEAIPGHYVQFEYANSIEPKARRALRGLFGSGVYVEGWAVYATEIMIDAGYMNHTPELRLTFGKQLLRAIANAILDIRLHTKGMTEADAMDLMVKQTFQEREEATAKWQRAQLSSCQLPTYYTGYKEWKRLRAEFETKPGFKPNVFHERALNAGALPMKTLAALLAAEAGAAAK